MKKTARFLTAALCIIMLIAVTTGCSSDSKILNLTQPEQGDEVAVIKTNMGDITVMFFEEVAPKAVENFKTHAKEGYYDGVIFHRVIEDFMIQGGDPTGTGTGGESIWGEDFEDEFSDKALNIRGALSMANTGMPSSNSSQFFIVQSRPSEDIDQIYQIYEDNGTPLKNKEIYAEYGGTPWLDGKHTVFGQVIDGMDVVDLIASSMTDENDKPIDDVVIESIELVEYTAE